jgi:hypothetical protein
MQVQIYPSKKSVQFVSCTKSVPVPTISLGIRIMGIVDGACVYAARILYNKLAMASTGDYISFPDDCNPSGLYKTDTKVMLPDSKYFDVQIVPNPNNGNFDIVINQGNANTLDVTLTDMLGKVYKKQLLQIVNNHASIHANVAAGVYFLTCKNSENETVVKKIIIQ